MADRYWVGGNGSWNSFTTTNWSATTGGAGGASVPTSADNVFFDANSGATNFIVTVEFGAACANLTVSIATAGRLTFEGFPNGTPIYAYSAVSINAATTISPASPISLSCAATSASHTITTNNVRFFAVYFGETASTATWTLGSGLTAQSLVMNVAGTTLNTNGQTVTITTQYYFGSACFFNVQEAATLTLGASAINIGASASEFAGSVAYFQLTSLATINANTSVITLGSTSTVNWNDSAFTGGGKTYATVVMNGNRSFISGTNTFTTRFAKNTVFNTSYLWVEDNQTLNSGHTFQLIGTATERLLVMSSVSRAQRTFTLLGTTGTRTLSFVNFMDIALSFGSAVGGTSLGDMLGNSGISFTPPTTRYLILGTATLNFTDTNAWSANPSGIPTGASVPLPQDTIILNANSGTGTLFLDALYIGSINTTGFLGNVTYAAAYNLYFVGPQTDTINLIRNANLDVVYRFDSNINLPASPCNATKVLYTDGGSATANLSANTTVGAVIYLSGGFATSNFNLNAASISSYYLNNFSSYIPIPSSSFSSRTLSLGSSYVTLTSSSPLNLDLTTLNAGTSTIEVVNASGNSCSFTGITIATTFNNLKLTKTSSATVFTYSGLNNGTYSNITISPHTSLIKFDLPAGSTITVNSLTTNASRGNGIIIGVALNTTLPVTLNATFAIGSNIETEYVAFLGITKSGASTLYARGAADLGANQNISFQEHSVIAFSGSGASSFTVPNNFNGSNYFLVLGAGGGAGKRNTSIGGSGGGGGGAIALASNLNISAGQTIYLNSPTGGAGATASGAGGSPANAWINISANSQPTLLTNGAYADSGNGSPGVSSTLSGSGGLLGSSLGHLVYSGASGGSSTIGGGGGGAGGNLIFRTGKIGASGNSTGGSGGGSIQNAGVSSSSNTGGAGGAVSPNAGGAGGTGSGTPQPGGSGVAGSSVGGGGGGGTSTSNLNGGAGGDGAAGSQWTYKSLNGVLSSGTIGYGGGAGGGGGSNATTNGAGGRGGNGGNGAGAGGGGRGSSSGGATGNGGNGGDALVLFVYVESKNFGFGGFIG